MALGPKALAKLQEFWTPAFWHVHHYVPSSGEFPIHDINGELVYTSYGQKEIHDDDSRIKLISGGVRGGKSMILSMEGGRYLIIEDGLCWIIGPTYELANPEFMYLYRGVEALGYIADKSIPARGPRQFVTTWGYKVETKTADELERIAGEAPDLLILPEINQSPPDILNKAYERGLEKRARIFGGGTLERSKVWFQKALEKYQGINEVDAKSFFLPSWTNPKNFPGGREDPAIVELERLLGPELFLERCAAIPAKPSGLVHRPFDHRKHVLRLDFDPELPVEIAIDPGQHTYAILAIQWRTVPGIFVKDQRTDIMVPLTEVLVIDEVYRHDLIAQDIIPIVKAKSWFKHVKSGTIDVAGRQHHANKSQIEIWYEETGLSLRSKKISIGDGIDVVNLRLGNQADYGKPTLYFDYRLSNDILPNGKALGILAEMGLYKWPDWNEGTGEKRNPIDSNNDACKALAYWLYDKYGPTIERKPQAKPRVRRYH